jgi:transposase
VGSKKYPDELKARAVRLYKESDPKPVIRRLAEQLGIHPEALRDWIRQDRAGAAAVAHSAKPAADVLAENLRLRKQVAELERVNDVLRSASAYFAAELGQTRR